MLLEIALQVISAAFPETFVCFGGSALVLFFGSARVSADLDLIVCGEQTPGSEALIAELAFPLAGTAQLFSISGPEFTTAHSAENHYKILVSTQSQRLFSIDVSKISGTIRSEVTDARLAIDSLPSATAKVVTRNWMLLQKAEAFLTRRVLRCAMRTTSSFYSILEPR